MRHDPRLAPSARRSRVPLALTFALVALVVAALVLSRP